MDDPRPEEICGFQALSLARTVEDGFEILRGLMERVVLHPTEAGLEVGMVGEIVRRIELGLEGGPAALSAAAASSVKVVAGAGFEPATFRL